VLVAHFGGGVQWAVDEWRWDALEAGPLSPVEQARRIARWLGPKHITQVSIDPHALGMWRALRHEVRSRHVLADNTVVAGIQYMQHSMDEGRLQISSRCTHLVREMQNYAWDEHYGQLGQDKPVKENDHGVDALRYDQWSMAGPNRQVRRIRSMERARG